MFPYFLLAQINDGFHIYKYASGIKSSSGYIKNGKPDGYWFTFYESGKLKSEGNRINFQLDSIWKFYNEKGILISLVNFKKGKKNGFKCSYNTNSIIVKKELFKEDTICSVQEFYNTGQIKLHIPFKNGLMHGFSFEYDSLGVKKTWLEYNNGKKKNTPINRYNNQYKRSGKWVEFESDILIHEANYVDGLKDGVEKFFDKKGNLIKILQYKNGLKIKDFNKNINFVHKKEFKTSELPSKNINFKKNGIPNIIEKEFSENGNKIHSNKSKIGIITSKGTRTKSGKKDGYWEIFYPLGEKKSEGIFKNDKKIGHWKYFYKNGLIESEGNYDIYGKQEGVWMEYYESGNLSQKINFLNGLYEGEFIGYNDTGKIIVRGFYKEDYEYGDWFYSNGLHSQYGSFVGGLKNGEWKHYYRSKQIVFKGNFINGIPDGEHLFWYENGNIKRFGKYSYGKRSGEWIQYKSNGKLFMIVYFENGLEKSINGYNLNPKHDLEDFIEFEHTGYKWLD